MKNGIIWMKNRKYSTHKYIILAIMLPFFLYPAECENTCEFLKNSMVSIRIFLNQSYIFPVGNNAFII